MNPSLFFSVILLGTLILEGSGHQAVCSIDGPTLDLSKEVINCCLSRISGVPLHIFLTSNVVSPPILLNDTRCNNMVLDLNGHTISAPPKNEWKSPIPQAYFLVRGLHSVTVTNGTIDGNGEVFISFYFNLFIRPGGEIARPPKADQTLSLMLERNQ